MTLITEHTANRTVGRLLNAPAGHGAARPFVWVIAFVLALGIGQGRANADFKLCNTTGSQVGVAIGYKDTKGWATEGWWNVAPHRCETLLKGSLIARYYYIHAVDYDRGGEWGGKAFMCTDDKVFTIRGVKECDQRGYRRTGFFEVDTGEEKDWTVRLTDPSLADEKAK